MSIVPLMFRDWWDEWDRPSRLLDQHFGMGLRRDDLLSSLSHYPTSSLFRNSYFRPWRNALAKQESSSTINMTKDKFETSNNYHKRVISSRETWTGSFPENDKVILDVQQFTPEEITVKTSNNCVVVEGKHEEKQDEHGFISRQFTRRYILPNGYDVADLVSTLSSDGVLTITAPHKTPPVAGERIVPLTRTGPAKPATTAETPAPMSPHQPQSQPREQTVPIVTSP